MGFTELAFFSLVVSTLFSVHSASEAKAQAKEEQKTREQQAALQARQEEIRSQRAARLQRARLLGAQAAQGASSSTVAGGVEAINTQEISQFGLIESQLALQNQQFSLQTQQTVSQANAEIAQTLGNFVATAFTPTGESKTSLFQDTFRIK